MMTKVTDKNWTDQNQHFLSTRLKEIANYMNDFPEKEAVLDFSESEAIAKGMDVSPALLFIKQAFGLSHFESFILTLCAGYELDASFAQTVDDYSTGTSTKPSFALALGLYKDNHWSATTPAAPLRHWRLIELENGSSLINSRLRIDERILHYLTGVSYCDNRIQSLIKPVHQIPFLAPSFSESVKSIVNTWIIHTSNAELSIIQLSGARYSEMFAVAASACKTMDLLIYELAYDDVPSDVTERDALIKLWIREAIIDRAVLLVNISSDTDNKMLNFIESIHTPLILISNQALDISKKTSIRIEIQSLSPSQQKDIWNAQLGEKTNYINGGIDGLVSQFNLSADLIQSIGKQVSELDNDSGKELSDILWQSCRVQSRKTLDTLAQRVSSSLTWDDLIVPESQKQTLHDIVSHARKRFQVYDTWGFASKSTAGQGISAVFHGPSGTGKTMAASVIAHELQLDLYRIDLSQVVNKYIGETEKNIGKVFDAAEQSGAILLFDEADALFAKRTEVKTSHDRNANMETSYLLQRMESYPGIAILTTNLFKEMDTAFMRRIRFAVQFPFPDQKTREEIWQKVFPNKVPLENIDIARLANLDVTGGNIKNIALNAAFLAADANESVKMSHLAKAARRELGKLEKSIKESELRSWL